MKDSLVRALQMAEELRTSIKSVTLPPVEGAPSPSDDVIYFSLVRGTRGYIEQIVHQLNGSYGKGWYDASLVMIRRLIETLIIEVFEAHKLEAKIKDPNGDFVFLRELIVALESEPSWTLSRNSRKVLGELKDVGDKSAHSRRFTAHRKDVERLIPALRVVVQELIYLAKLK
jgi:hypothetical protein